MRFYTILSFCIYLSILGCISTDSLNVSKQSVVIPLGEEKSLPADLYQSRDAGKNPALILASAENPGNHTWDEFATKIASMGYFVLALQQIANETTAADRDSFYIKNLTTALKYVKSLPGIQATKIGLLGAGSAGIAALHVAAADSNVAAVITLGAAKYFSAKHNTILPAIPPRPLLIIESTRDPQKPEAAKVNYFDFAHQPKKLVWLATAKEGVVVLSTDMEPIVRRTTLMLIDRYLKGK